MVEQVLYVLTKISSSLLHDIVSIQSYLKVGAGWRFVLALRSFKAAHGQRTCDKDFFFKYPE